jgi:acyl carrier protein
MKEQVLKEVTEVYRKVLKQPELELKPETTANDVEGWDSLNHTILMSEVQKHFNIKFALKEMIKFRNIGDMLSVIEEKIQPSA